MRFDIFSLEGFFVPVLALDVDWKVVRFCIDRTERTEVFIINVYNFNPNELRRRDAAMTPISSARTASQMTIIRVEPVCEVCVVQYRSFLFW